MRHHRLILLLLIPLLLFAACQKGQNPLTGETESPLKGHSGNYSTTANITYRELTAQAVIDQQTPQSCSVTFQSPESVRDLAFVFWGDRVDMSYKGLSFTFDPHSVPGSAVAKMAVGAINAAMKDDGIAVAWEEEVLTLSGMMENGTFQFRLDGESGHLLKLSVPAEELEIEFLNFTFLD